MKEKESLRNWYRLQETKVTEQLKAMRSPGSGKKVDRGSGKENTINNMLEQPPKSIYEFCI